MCFVVELLHFKYIVDLAGKSVSRLIFQRGALGATHSVALQAHIVSKICPLKTGKGSLKVLENSLIFSYKPLGACEMLTVKIVVIVDFGIDTLVKLAHETHFPWLLSNVRDVKTDQPLAEGITSHVITCQGRKVSLAL